MSGDLQVKELDSCGLCIHANTCRLWYRVFKALGETPVCGWGNTGAEQPVLRLDSMGATLRRDIAITIAEQCDQYEEAAKRGQ